jgi:hypothetical protein
MRDITMWKRIVTLSIIAGCGARDDTAKTNAFVESYDRAMTKVSSICGKVSKQVFSGKPLTQPQRAAFIIVYARAAADVKFDDAPASLRACHDAANDAFAKLRSATAETLVKANGGNNVETIAFANATAPAVEDALRELKIAAESCKRDALQIRPSPVAMLSPYFVITPACL